MIRSYRNKALQRFGTMGSPKGLSVQKPEWIARLLMALAAATRPEAMDLPGLRFHPLKGKDKGRNAVWANQNWRLTFSWDGTDAIEVGLEGYH